LDYVNCHGFFKVDPTWPSGLQVAAKWSWALGNIPPLDYVVFERLVQQVAGRDGDILPDGFVALALGHFLKWPGAVCIYTSKLRAQARPWGACGLLDAFWAAVVAMDGLPLATMHQGMSAKGRMHATTGLVVHAQHLGLIVKVDDKKSVKVEHTLTLGKGQTKFQVAAERFPDAVCLIDLWLAEAPHVLAFGPHGPAEAAARAADLEAIANTVLHGMATLRRSSCRGSEGTTVGPMNWPQCGGRPAAGGSPASDPADGTATKRAKLTPPPPGYLCQHFTRAVLLAMDALFWHTPWHVVPWTMGQLAKWCPDETGQCVCIAEMPLSEAVDRFSCSPLMVSCWACFGSGLDEDEVQKVMQASDREVNIHLLRLSRRCRPEDLEGNPDQFSPVIRDILHELLSSKDANGSDCDASEVTVASESGGRAPTT
jgi:hypothetical protein